jgi:hypothetical protein
MSNDSIRRRGIYKKKELANSLLRHELNPSQLGINDIESKTNLIMDSIKKSM